MDSLINVRVENDRMITDSRNVAEVFAKQHKHVLDSIRTIEKDVPNFRQMFFEGTMPDNYGREQKVYFMSRDGFVLLAMGFTGKDALQWKLKYIDAFNQLERAWNTPEAVMARALKLANKQLDEMKSINLRLTETVSVQEQQIAELTPKASYYDLILNNKDLVSITEIAKDYGKSGRWLNEKLHELGIQFKQGSKIWLLYQKYASKGYTSTKTQTYNGDDGFIHTRVHTYWTQKGRLFIYDILKGEGIFPLIERDQAITT